MSTVTAVTASPPLASSGGTTPNISLTTPLPVADGGPGSTAPSLVGGTNPAIAVSIAGSWPNQTVSAALSPANDLTQLGWFSVKDFGATGNGSTDDTTSILNALAALNDTSGVLYFPAGTYLVSAPLAGQNDTLFRYWVGAGMDVTIIRVNPMSESFPSGTPVVSLQSNGGVLGMTIDANAISGIALGFGDTAALALDHWRCVDVRAMNVVSTGRWVALFGDANGSGFLINELRIVDCIFEGPSNPSTDGFAIVTVSDCFVTNLTLRNMGRSPNFYFIDKLKVNGLSVTGIPSEAGVVFENTVNHVELCNAYVDSTCAPTLIKTIDFRGVNCVFESGINFALIGQTLDLLPSGLISADFINCQFGKNLTSAIPMKLNGQGAADNTSGAIINWIRCTNCEFAATTNSAHVYNDFVPFPPATSTIWPEMSLIGCRFDSTHLTGGACSFTSSSAATTPQPFVVVGCVNLATVNPLGFYGTTTLGALSNIRSNVGFNPRGSFTPSTAIASGVTWTNATGYDVTILIYGGTVTGLSINGVATTLTAGAFLIPIGATIKVTWSTAPHIAYMGS